MGDDLQTWWQDTEAADSTSTPSKRLRAAISDAFTFIRSLEANQAFADVTLEQLIGDAIQRNGDSERSNKAQYDPYSFDPEQEEPAGDEPVERANFLGGADTSRPTKLDRVLALKNALSDVIADIKKREPVDVADPEEYTDSLETSI